ncbi:MFS transporter [Burkholderia alba]|uniref:MFS transporter n=1 Tax=Burkholderia alba TaxID=2683677 RepID=UPI002B05F29F|nr:MFS transporter [Burkholderia alba]
MTRAAARHVLAATCISYVVVLLDTSIVNVALDRIGASLDVGIAGIQWIMNAYTLAFASLLLTGGTLGDRWGARRLYLAGLIVFTLASALCGVATSLPALAGARALQGVGAALLVPCALKLINRGFPDPRGRARAIGLWIGCGGVAMAAGPLIGGLLIRQFDWRAIFFVNVPVGLAGLWLAARIAPDRGRPANRRLDLPGQIAAIVALGSLIGVLIEGHALGWRSPPLLAGIAATAAAWTAFLAIEQGSAQPMLPLSFFGNRVFAGSTGVSMASAFVFYGLLFAISVDWQHARGASALATGLALLPMTAMVAAGSLASGRLAARFGARASMCAAFGAYAGGALGLLWCGPGSPAWYAIAPMLAIGGASGFVSPAATAPAMETVDPQRAGIAAAVLNAARQAGAALGVAVFGALLAAAPDGAAGMRTVLEAAAAVAVLAALAWGCALRERGGIDSARRTGAAAHEQPPHSCSCREPS